MDTDVASELAKCLEKAASPLNQDQQEVAATLTRLQGHKDYLKSLLFIFIAKALHPDVRQRAGLLLKNSLVNRAADDQQTRQDILWIIETTLNTINDPERTVRETGGTIIAAMFQKIGGNESVKVLEVLINNLDCAEIDVKKGSFSALSKICEDFVDEWSRNYDQDAHAPPHFLLVVKDRLIPKLFAMITQKSEALESVHDPWNSRKKYCCIEILNHFALNRCFEAPPFQSGPENEYINEYVKVVDVLSQHAEPEILREVCKGLVYLVTNHHRKLLANVNGVVDFMLRASNHSDDKTRIQALEFWIAATSVRDFCDQMRIKLEAIVGVLLRNMRYAPADYMSMAISNPQNDDSNVPDRQEDIAPQFHHKRGETQEDDEETSGPWGGEWTARKAAATALDYMSSQYGDELFGLVKPLIEMELAREDDWEAQESAVLAIGAIAYGCWHTLRKHSKEIINVLVNLSKSGHPLLRSICCWCISRFSEWICSENNLDHKTMFDQAVFAILERIAEDNNKRVQEAACSAFATLEEEARHLLARHLDNIIPTLTKAFGKFQQKNMLSLYDVCGTLAEAVGPELNNFRERFLPPLMAQLQKTNNHDSAILALFPCLTSCARHLGEGFFPCHEWVVRRCANVIDHFSEASKAYKQNPHEVDRPVLDAMASALDLLAGLVEGLGPKIQDVLRENNFVQVLGKTIEEDNIAVKQSTFALMGDCAKHCSMQLKELLKILLPECTKGLMHMSASIANNASWAIGEICMMDLSGIQPGFVNVLMSEGGIVATLLDLLRQSFATNRTLVKQNTCITLGRIGHVCPDIMASAFARMVQPWCMIMADYPIDPEKLTAFEGFCKILRHANGEDQLRNSDYVLHAIASFRPGTHNGKLHTEFQQIVCGYRETLGDNWPLVLQKLTANDRANIGQY